MDDTLFMQVNESPKNLFHYSGRTLLCELFCYDFFKELAALTQFQDEDVVRFVVVDFVEFGDVGMVKGHHDGHLFEQFLMFCLFELGLFDALGCSVESSVAGFYFVYAAKTASTDFFENGVIFKVISFFHFNKFIPLDFDLFDFL